MLCILVQRRDKRNCSITNTWIFDILLFALAILSFIIKSWSSPTISGRSDWITIHEMQRNSFHISTVHFRLSQTTSIWIIFPDLFFFIYFLFSCFFIDCTSVTHEIAQFVILYFYFIFCILFYFNWIKL